MGGHRRARAAHQPTACSRRVYGAYTPKPLNPPPNAAPCRAPDPHSHRSSQQRTRRRLLCPFLAREQRGGEGGGKGFSDSLPTSDTHTASLGESCGGEQRDSASSPPSQSAVQGVQVAKRTGAKRREANCQACAMQSNALMHAPLRLQVEHLSKRMCRSPRAPLRVHFQHAVRQ